MEPFSSAFHYLWLVSWCSRYVAFVKLIHLNNLLDNVAFPLLTNQRTETLWRPLPSRQLLYKSCTFVVILRKDRKSSTFKNFLPRKEILCNFLSQEEISCNEEIPCCRKIFHVTWNFSCCRMIFPVIEQNFLSREEISSHRKTGKQLMPQEDYCHHKKKFNPKEQNFKPQEEISYNREKFFFRKNFMSQEEIPFHSKKFPVTDRIFLTQEEISIFIKSLNN